MTGNAPIDQTDDVLALESLRERAMLEADVDTLERLFSDDLVYVHTTGKCDTKASYLEAVRTEFVKYRYIERIDERSFLEGDVAYLVGHQIGLSILAGEPRLMNCHYLAIWKRVAGRWQFCAWHATAPTHPA